MGRRFPGSGLTRSGDTSKHIEHGGLDNDSECTSVHVCYVKRRLCCVELLFVVTSSSIPPTPPTLQIANNTPGHLLKSISFSELQPWELRGGVHMLLIFAGEGEWGGRGGDLTNEFLPAE